MGEPDTKQQRLVVLIDADNASAALIAELLAEVAKYGIASVKRAYGNWTTPNLGGWKNTLLAHSIQPVQQFNYTTGKNATDSAMIIDAMDLLYTDRFDGFCIVSSDSDFTRLASRIREQGLAVYGFGAAKTPKPFVRACDKFIYTEVLAVERPETAVAADDSVPSPERASAAASQAAAPAVAGKKAAMKPAARAAVKKIGAANPTVAPVSAKAAASASKAKTAALLARAVDAASGDDGWANLGAVGSNLNRIEPDFDPRNYGFGKLRDLFAAWAGFTLEERNGHGKPAALYVRRKK